MALLAPLEPAAREALVGELCDLLAHRGPDGSGSFSQPASQPPSSRCGITLGHRRLAIIDRSATAAQPMVHGDLAISYNGEFYNYREQRARLLAAGVTLRGHSDTEVLLALLAERGLPAALGEVNGMFAFALWDQAQRCLWLGRDRFGEKPLYYLFDGRRCVVASEIKALRHAARRLGIAIGENRAVLACYLADADYETGDATFYGGIQRVRPGELLRIQTEPDGRLTLHRQTYYELSPARCPPSTLPCPTADDEFRALLESSLRLRLRSDVEVAACLSGGLDSSTLVCLAQQLGVGLRSFSAVYKPGESCDERQFIDVVVAHCGTANRRIDPTALLTPQSLTALLRQHDEPVGSPSVFAQYAVYQLIGQQGLRVALSGQGADECLTGYHGALPLLLGELLRRRRWLPLLGELEAVKAWPALSRLGTALRTLLRRQLPTGAEQRWLAGRWRQSFRRQRFFHLGELDPPPLPLPLAHAAAFADRSLLHGYLYSLLAGSSLATILRYEDRNSMAASVESRAPFLDHRIIEHCLGRPAEALCGGGQTKLLLRRSCADLLPSAVVQRQDKVGFATPASRWLRGPLRPLVEDLLGSPAMAQRGLFATGELRRHYAAAQAEGGPPLDSRALWKALNVELWLRHCD